MTNEAAIWRKSSYSGPEINCVEVAHPAWRKSSYSGSETNCVETAHSPARIAVRDSKHPGHPHLGFDPPAWAAFLHTLKTAAPRL